jgi:DNA repair exonuclease SbcCD ATPase subunit
MKLRTLELEQFRKFDRPVRVASLADGLNLVVGPNEMGKSTLFAALRAVLFERHRSQAQTVRSLQPAGHEGAAPSVALEFEIGGEHYRIEKRFLRRPSAELALPDGRRLHGEPAEEMLDELLAGTSRAGARTGSAHGAVESLGAWSLLWVGQGQSFVLPEIAPGARGALQTALDAELGEILAGDHGTALLKTLEQALQELVYKAGRPRGRYKEAEDTRQRLEIELGELETRRGEFERDLNDLDEARADCERLRAEQSEGREEAALTDLTSRRERLQIWRAELGEAEADLKARRAELEQAEAEQARCQALAAELAKLDAEIGQTRLALAEATAAAETAEALASEHAGRVERLQATHDQASDHQRGLQRLVQAIRQRDAGRAALQAAASEIAFELEPEALARVRIDGRPLGEADCSIRIVEPLSITIEGVGRITARPLVPERRRLQASVREAERQIGRELDALGLRPPSPKRRQLELALAADGTRAVPAVPIGATDAPPEPTAWPEPQVVERALAGAEQQIDSVSAQLRPARVGAARAMEDRHRQAAARAEATARLGHAEHRLEQLRAEATAAERAGDADDLPVRVGELQDRVGAAERRLRQLQEQAPQEPLEKLEQEIVGRRAAIEQRARLLRERELALERLRERIHVVAAGGLDERLAGTRRRFEELERECAKYRRDLEALELLLRVLRDAERDAKERYLGPVLRRLRPSVQALFPGADLEIDDGFRITAVARAGAPEPFEHLSDGTREQIAILARLAFAELLADQGRPAVVVLDDALVFSDDQRIEQMFELLARAGARLQILILTCRERVFRGLAAHRLRLEPVKAFGAR